MVTSIRFLGEIIIFFKERNFTITLDLCSPRRESGSSDALEMTISENVSFYSFSPFLYPVGLRGIGEIDRFIG